jgi:hypothetical protein
VPAHHSDMRFTRIGRVAVLHRPRLGCAKSA